MTSRARAEQHGHTTWRRICIDLPFLSSISNCHTHRRSNTDANVCMRTESTFYSQETTPNLTEKQKEQTKYTSACREHAIWCIRCTTHKTHVLTMSSTLTQTMEHTPTNHITKQALECQPWYPNRNVFRLDGVPLISDGKHVPTTTDT